MTQDEVTAAVQALKDAGKTPTQRAVLAYLGKGSQRDVAKYLRELGCASAEISEISAMNMRDEADADDAAVVAAHDQLRAATAALASATAALDIARGAHLRWSVQAPALHDPRDPGAEDMRHQANAAQHAYAQAVGRYDAARMALQAAQAALAIAERQVERQRRVREVEAAHPELCTEIRRLRALLAEVNPVQDAGRHARVKYLLRQLMSQFEDHVAGREVSVPDHLDVRTGDYQAVQPRRAAEAH